VYASRACRSSRRGCSQGKSFPAIVTTGPIGVVTVLMSYLIGYGVCLHLGAVVGRMWGERWQPSSPDNETGAPPPLDSGFPRPEVEP
jgi:hypothetical protein